MTNTGITSAYVHKQMSVSEGGSKGRNKTESTRERDFVRRERERDRERERERERKIESESERESECVCVRECVCVFGCVCVFVCVCVTVRDTKLRINGT